MSEQRRAVWLITTGSNPKSSATLQRKKVSYILINGYVQVYMPEHHLASANGMVYEHMLVAERMLGRPLRKEEVVHHKDTNRSNNNPNNLLVFASTADDTAFHIHGFYFLDWEGVAHCNIRSQSFCEICGKEISHRAKRCRDCQKERKTASYKVSRDNLKKLIYTNSFESIGRMFNVTGNAVKKWCKFYELPYRKQDIEKFSKDEWSQI